MRLSFAASLIASVLKPGPCRYLAAFVISQPFQQAADTFREWLSSLLEFEIVGDAVAFLMAPGLLLFQELHLPSSGENWQLAAFLLGWFFWVRVARVSYFITARAFGFYSPEQFLFWTRLWLPWRNPYQSLMSVFRWWRQVRFGKGANRTWTSIAETFTYVFDPAKDCILVGRAWFHRLGLFQPIAIPGGERHVFICAGSGAGKTTHLMTMLGCLAKSAAAFVVDCDGSMVNALGASLQAAGHNVIKLDPDNIAKGFPASGKWNPMDELTRAANKRHGRASVVSFASILANALIVQDSTTQPVFADTARVFMKGLILYVWLVEKNKTLLRVRELLTCGLPEKIRPGDKDPDPFQALLNEMSLLGTWLDDGCNGEICKAIAAAGGVMNMGRQEKGNNFKSTAIYQTAWLDDPACRATMGSSDICGEDLKLTNTVVFMVATLTDIQTRLAPWFRAFSLMTLYAFQRTKPEMKLKHPCLFILDEFPSLGRMEIVATAAPGFRKYCVRLVTVTQSLQRMQKTYPQEWRDFLGNAQCCIWMGLDDPDTLKFLSEEMLGKYLHKQKIDGWHWLPRLPLGFIGLKLPPARYQLVERLLMDPQQCRAFLDPTTWQMIVTRFGRQPMRLKRLAYFKELPVWRYAASPGHGEKFLRSQTRFLISQFSKGSMT